MATTVRSGGPQQVPSWVLTANEVIERLLLLVRINLAWWGLTLLGLVVLGLAPATAAAADALLASREDRRMRVLPLMWESWRRHLVRANTRMLPLIIVQVAAVATLLIGFSGAIASRPAMIAAVGVAAISLGWSTVSLAAILASARLRRQDLVVTWRLALLLPGALPGRSLVMIVVLALWSGMSLLIPPLSLLVGTAAALDLVIGLFGRRIESLLEEIDRAQGASG